MTQEKFNPFQFRKDRDIRNSLSSSLAQSLKVLSPAPFEDMAAKLLQNVQAPTRRHYITDRLARYQKCLTRITEQRIKTTVEQAAVFWDEKLFFEVHEILEEIWMTAKGREKSALQGLIRAAGVYVHLENNNRAGAKKMAAKAIPALEADLSVLSTFPNGDLLVAKLKGLDPSPPRLSE